MIFHPEHEDVAVERRSILLPDHQESLRGRKRVGAAARDEELVVENSIVFVGNLLVHDVLIFRLGHHHQVVERVVQVAGIVHMHVSRPAVPPLGGHVGHPSEVHAERGDLMRLDSRPRQAPARTRIPS